MQATGRRAGSGQASNLTMHKAAPVTAIMSNLGRPSCAAISAALQDEVILRIRLAAMVGSFPLAGAQLQRAGQLIHRNVDRACSPRAHQARQTLISLRGSGRGGFAPEQHAACCTAGNPLCSSAKATVFPRHPSHIHRSCCPHGIMHSLLQVGVSVPR